MQKNITWIFLLFFPLLSIAQSKNENYFSATLAGGFTGASLSNSTSPILPKNSSDAMRFNFGIHGWYNTELNNNWEFQTGLGYLDAGFRRQQKNLKVGDETFPGVGEGMILDNSNQKKDINYDYRFHYIQVPVQFNYKLGRSKDFKSDFMLCGGVTLNVLVKHNITARLDNFTIDEKKKFQLDASGFSARTIAADVSLGFRMQHKVDKNITLVIQPALSYFPLSITSGNTTVNPYMVTLHAGVVLDFFNKQSSGN